MDDKKQKDTPKKLNLQWFNALAVLPFLALTTKAVVSHDIRFAFWALMFAPVALVTIGLDIYKLVQRFKTK